MIKKIKRKNYKNRSKSSNALKTERHILEEIIRVNHAGELGATRIYDGQIAVFGKNSKIGKRVCNPKNILIRKLFDIEAIKEIWNGEKMKIIRKGLTNNDPIKVCQLCLENEKFNVQ